MSLYVDHRGHGPIPLVLLHGWAMHGGVLAPLAEALEEQCTMYLVDLPGHGRSRDCGLPLEPRACAAAIVSCLMNVVRWTRASPHRSLSPMGRGLR